MALTANVVSWRAAAVGLAALVVSGVLQLLIERQRQHAFKAVVTGGPEDKVVVMQYSGTEGRYMRASLSIPVSRQPADRP
jgi:hypothetical protein